MRRTLVPRLELALICLFGVGFCLILQQWSFAGYRWGLQLLIAVTLLNIAVGNLPKDASPLRAGLLTLLILAVVALVFGLGILLVPYLAQMGR